MKIPLFSVGLTVSICLAAQEGSGGSGEFAGWRSVIEDGQEIELKIGKYWRIDGDTLIGDSGKEEGGATTFGKQDWHDYELDFHVTMEQGGNASHFVRRTADGKKFYACNLLAGRNVFRVVLLDNTKQDPFHDLSVVDYDFREHREYHIRIAARGESITTYVDGKPVNHVTDDTLESGHAAFTLWYNKVRIRNPRYRLLD